MTAAFTFPGQGSQAVGMGKALAEAFPAARAVFDEVDAALGEKLTAIIWDGPAETLTAHRERPAGADGGVDRDAARAGGRGRLLRRAGCGLRRRPFARRIFGAGRGRQPHVTDTARLLRTRGHAMQKAVPVGEGAMAALLGLDYEAAMRGRRRSRAGRRSARPPTTMAAGRSWSPATRPRSSARSRSPRPRAPSARCCCRCPRRSIAR